MFVFKLQLLTCIIKVPLLTKLHFVTSWRAPSVRQGNVHAVVGVAVQPSNGDNTVIFLHNLEVEAGLDCVRNRLLG